MGARGPAPTPTVLLAARGSWRAKDGREDEPQLPVEKPACPSWLKGEGRAEWNRQVKQLERMGCIAKVDRAMLASYCDAWGDFVRLVWRVQEQESLRLGTQNLEAEALADELLSDLERRKERVCKRLMQLADRFGFSPAARARVKSMGQPKQEQETGKGKYFSGRTG